MTPRWPIWSIDAAGLLGATLLAAGVYVAGVEPARRAAARDQDAREALDASKDELRTVARDLAQTREAAGAMRARLATLPTPVPISDQARRMRELGQAIQSHQVTLQEVVPGAARTEGRHAAVPVRLSGVGELSVVRGLLTDLHRDFPDFELVTLDVSATPDKPGPAPFSLELVWYAQTERAGGSDREAPGARNGAGKSSAP